MNNLLILIISHSLGLLLPLLEISEKQKLCASIATANEALLLAGTDFLTFHKEEAIMLKGMHPPSTINSILYKKYKKSWDSYFYM